MTLKIISPTQTIFEGEVQSVTLPGTMGQFTVLNNHAALISTLAPGNIMYTTTDSQSPSFQIPGGIADIRNNIISVCTY